MDMSYLKDLSQDRRLFTETSMRLMMGFANISLFRHIASIGLNSSSPQLRSEFTQLFHEFETNPDFARILVPIDPSKPSKPGWSLRVAAATADSAVQQQQQSFSVAVDAASLVFAHSILDDAAIQYCRVTALVSPQSWESFVSDRKVKLEEARNNNYEGLRKQKIDSYLKELERESLRMKTQKLFAVCEPKCDFKPIKGFSYDSSRLEDLDKLRHDIIHGSGPVNNLPNGDSDLLFMEHCGLYLMGLVNEYFGLQIVLPPETQYSGPNAL